MGEIRQLFSSVCNREFVTLMTKRFYHAQTRVHRLVARGCAALYANRLMPII
jgi:hypothetical protein